MSRAKNLANLIGGASAGTGGLALPSGTTAERPSSPVTGLLRFNTTLGNYETYNGTKWVVVGGRPDLTYTYNTILEA
ncbi:MAG: hypothetical protein EBU08_19595 [Micrococcales bacterium]|jgi:hypothetical protein|nr:hypothetical protein [Micrococcales bacterium]